MGPGVCKIALCGGDISAECVPSVPRLNRRRDEVLAPGPLLQLSLRDFLGLAHLGHEVGLGARDIALCGGEISAQCVPSVPGA